MTTTYVTLDTTETAGISGLRKQWNEPVVLMPVVVSPTTGVLSGGAAFYVPQNPTGPGSTYRGITAASNGRRISANWFADAPSRQPASPGALNPGALVFDAVHRSLLVRFPGCAQEIASKLAAGNRISKLELLLDYFDTELWPEGYIVPPALGSIGSKWRDTQPNWNAVAFALRKPWKADPTDGPTYNAYINGKGFWKEYGAANKDFDRFVPELGSAEVSSSQPVGAIDVTDTVNNTTYGATLQDRIIRLEACGFIVKKQEIYDVKFCLPGVGDEWTSATGGRGILLKRVRLKITYEDMQPPVTLVLPNFDLDFNTLKATLAATPDGSPTATLPTAGEIATLANDLRFQQPSWMTETWQWNNVSNLARLRGDNINPVVPPIVNIDPAVPLFPEANSVAGFEAWIDIQLGVPPRTSRFLGQGGAKGAPELISEYFRYQAALSKLPSVIDHWSLYWWSWLAPGRAYPTFSFNSPPPRGWARGINGTAEGPSGQQAQAYYTATKDWRGNFSIYRTYTRIQGTANYNFTAIAGACGGSKQSGSPALIESEVIKGIEENLVRKWCWQDGSFQEFIDHYYLGFSLKASKALQCISVGSSSSPYLAILNASVQAKMIEGVTTLWHPRLRRFTSPSDRTGIAYLVGIQEGASCVVHTLSPNGALTDVPSGGAAPPAELSVPRINSANVSKMPVFAGDVTPAEVAFLFADPVAPWAPTWVSNIIDNKPIPFWAVSTSRDYASFPTPPRWKCSYQGANYGLASVDIASKKETNPFMAQWRRSSVSSVNSMLELSTLIAKAAVNRTEMLYTEGGEPANAPESAIKQMNAKGQQGQYQFAVQYRNKAVFLASPVTRGAAAGSTPWSFLNIKPNENIKSIQCTISLISLSAPTWKIYVGNNPTPIAVFPPHQIPLSTPYDFKASVIFLEDGDTYLAIIPLPGTNLGRDADVEIFSAPPFSTAIPSTGEIRPTKMQGGGGSGGDCIMQEALRINLYNYKSSAALPRNNNSRRDEVNRAFSGFVLEMGDASDSSSFATFRTRILNGSLTVSQSTSSPFRVDIEFTSGGDTLRTQFLPLYNGEANPTLAFPAGSRTVALAGSAPTSLYNKTVLGRPLDIDTNLTQQGKSGELNKNGAIVRLETKATGYLQTEPQSGTSLALIASLPDTDFTSWFFSAPIPVPGHPTVVVTADGRLGLLQVVIQKPTAPGGPTKIWVTYGLSVAQKGSSLSQVASGLFFAGLSGPVPIVVLNGSPYTSPLDSITIPAQTVTTGGVSTSFPAQAGLTLPLPEGPGYNSTTFSSRYTSHRNNFPSFFPTVVIP